MTVLKIMLHLFLGAGITISRFCGDPLRLTSHLTENLDASLNQSACLSDRMLYMLGCVYQIWFWAHILSTSNFLNKFLSLYGFIARHSCRVASIQPYI